MGKILIAVTFITVGCSSMYNNAVYKTDMSVTTPPYGFSVYCDKYPTKPECSKE